MIRTIIIEEHNEAFFVWNDSVQQGLIPHENCCLLHFDSHADIDVPLIKTSLNKQNLTLENIYDLTYNQLDLQNFITPCIYMGLFKEVYWYQPDHCKKKKGTLHIWSERNMGKKLFMSMKDRGVPSQKKCAYFWKNPADPFSSDSSSFVLDIDIDFFLCQDEPVPLMIETTQEEYEKYTSNRLHPLRFSMGNSVEALKKDGKYYFVFEFPDDSGIGGPKNHTLKMVSLQNKKDKPNFDENPLKEAEQKINIMIDFLKNNNITPDLINICRSHYSGYTPQKYSDELQKMVVTALQSLYELDIEHIDSLIKKEAFDLLISFKI